MRILRIFVLALVIPAAAMGCAGDDDDSDVSSQMGIEDAGDADDDGIDMCIFWSTEPGEYEACYEAGSDPGLGPGPGNADRMDFDPVPGND